MGIIDDIADPAARWAARSAVRTFIRASDNLVPKMKTVKKQVTAIERGRKLQVQNIEKRAAKVTKGKSKKSGQYLNTMRNAKKNASKIAVGQPTKATARLGRLNARVSEAETLAMKHFGSPAKFKKAVAEERKLLGGTKGKKK